MYSGLTQAGGKSGATTGGRRLGIEQDGRTSSALHVIALQWFVVAVYQAQNRLSIFGAWPVAVDRFAAAAGD